ncbi:LysR family transcriptional regulator [Mucilaginibacter auburnensis]|uniref:DNA-binding transcriptional LysR family regulator n=1 Tax=Mucilaginibacter auburnensis TaxID=1457233 RepID=A0A2H9VVB9_9SPHI|nr:LysR family transcriptional regulator [Mucilaginibacter auburnensis]PJJ84774.1 DNA-binding transcriptional LysR family regulator [Mucilaginibacter auburnensis]
MEIRHLIYFKTVAELLHFRKAAEALFISQPPLSRQIKELEDELGAQLFVRTNKRVQLTDAGSYFLHEVDGILTRLEESKRVTKQIHEAESGELRIGYISSLYQPRMAMVLKLLRENFPYVKTSLFERPTIKQIEALEQGRLDVGILRAPVQSTKLKVNSLYFEPFMLVMQAKHTLPISQNDIGGVIRNMPFIFFNKEYAPHYHASLLEICSRLGFVPNIIHEANNVHSILQLVEAGLGVSILPLSAKNDNKQLQFISLAHIPVKTEVVLAYKAAHQNAALKWFIENYSE